HDIRPPARRIRRASVERHASGPGSSRPRGGSEPGLISERDLRAIEKEHPDGLTSVQVVDFFTRRGIRFSEATFRKYVQQGLLPRSRRVGRKGKHRGSLGVYPARTVRRINAIKRLMDDGYTIEEIQEHFLRFTDAIEQLEEGFTEVFHRLEEQARAPRFDARARKSLEKDIGEARRSADELMRRIDGIARRATTPPEERFPGTGAPGGAEELL
ncbi:MAG TPA: MerR family transcriptional regulator, partial [Kofleriaceae bacterium]|nr:MerR family transcriptional regulator [Kofleriaceae bacterium]